MFVFRSELRPLPLRVNRSFNPMSLWWEFSAPALPPLLFNKYSKSGGKQVKPNKMSQFGLISQLDQIAGFLTGSHIPTKMKFVVKTFQDHLKCDSDA